jgi:circadian clock protein KaiC
MNVDDLFIYDLKYGKLNSQLINGEFYAIGDEYMNDNLSSIMERLQDYGYLNDNGSLFNLKCKYCGSDKFLIIPFSKSGNIPVDMDKSINNPDNLKDVYMCKDCKRVNVPDKSWYEYKKYSVKDIENNVATAIHEFTKILDENKLAYELPSLISINARSHIFTLKITDDYDYFIDIYSHADFKEILESTEPFKTEFPSRKIAIFNISDKFSDANIKSEIECYNASSKDDLVQKLKEYVNKIITSKEYRFGIDEFDNILLYGLEENNIYGIETFSSGNTVYLFLNF